MAVSSLDNGPAQGCILYCCADLLWATKIKSLADALKIPARPARDAAMIAARLADTAVAAVLVDLEAAGAWEVIAALRGAGAGAIAKGLAVVAFAPHVEVEKMRKAENEGVTAVFARGAFGRMLPDLLQRLSRGSASGVVSQHTD